MGWVVRAVLIIAGIVTSWFIAKDAVNFPIFQMAVALLLMVFAIAVLALFRRR